VTSLQHAYRKELADYRVARAAGDCATAWHALERGHIISQTMLLLHIHSHLMMLQYAIARREWSEAAGQVIRLVLAPLGTLIGRIPIGNTGRANISPFAAMPVPKDIAALLNDVRK